ncbi:restriction endonuclease subunit S [Metamycoplasma hyosynoviae]|uniref:restriction endonuclease subunit S n=2 Tax=Metamycoplasma hyosynoviae TaxID=29559 RepID=UPI00235DF658|nr:restriction endonuclease subunit S [Metamycoplasma hyosynoviae]MDD1359534.1 restriction endonuclease subunit S [Metamycoplasma hyosynoviae]MDD1371724.1 restriction endonuclease subunit S [Metamycoplasma hyosynoviae]
MPENKTKPEIRFKGFTYAWEHLKTKELCTISTGKSNTQDCVDDGIYPFYVRSEIVERSNRYLFDEEAVLTVGDGGIGKVFHYVNGKYDLHQRVYRMFNFSKEITAKYFYYYFSTYFYDRAMAMTAKTSVDSVRYEMIADMDISFPKVQEQKFITKFFENLDKIIDLHQRKCEKLQTIKKSLLSKMFPSDDKSIPEIRFNGYTYAWELSALGDLGTTFTGLSGKKKDDFGKGDAHFIPYLNVFNNPIIDPSFVESIEIDNSQNEVKYGDIFFTTSSETPDEVGMSSVWLSGLKNIYLNSFCFGYRLNFLENYDLNYLAYNFRSNSFRNHMILLAQGISRFNISKTRAMDIKISIPTLKEQQKIGNFFKNLDKIIDLHQCKCEKLQTIKKSLLGKMFC